MYFLSRIRFCYFNFILLHLISFFLLVPYSHSLDTTFLESNMSESGSISRKEDSALEWQSTTESIITLLEIGKSDSELIQPAQTYLNNKFESVVADTETLSNLLLTNSTSNQSSDIAELYRRQNSDGGLGYYADYDSDLISTSGFLRVLNQLKVVNDISGGAVAYLLSHQHEDGGWSLKGNSSQIEVTSIVINSLWNYRRIYDLSDALFSGVSFLSSQRSSDYLWENAEGSALALSSILKVDIDRDDYQNSFDAFTDLQNRNGSFYNDVYLTALGLRVLDSIEKPVPDKIIISGHIIAGGNGLPISGVVIELNGLETFSTLSDVNGDFKIDGIPPGNYQLLMSLEGFSQLSSSIFVKVGDKIDFGDIYLSKLEVDPETNDPVTTGIIRGKITDFTSGSPILGASVSILGSDLSATTNSDGFYQVTSVPAGKIQLLAKAGGYNLVSGLADLKAGQTLLFSPVMREVKPVFASLKGIIADGENGKPLPNAQINVMNLDGQSKNGVSVNDGTYSINQLPVGEVNIEVILDDYYPASAFINVKEGDQFIFSPKMVPLSQDPNVEIPKSGLSGAFIDSINGRGVKGAKVILLDAAGQELFSEDTDDDGEFVFEELLLDSSEVTVKGEKIGYTQFSTSINLPEGLSVNLGNIELDPQSIPLSSVFGTVLDVRSRKPIGGALITARNLSSGLLREVMSDNHGEFNLAGLDDGEYEITVAYSDYSIQQFSANISAGIKLDLGQVRLRQPGVDALLADLAISELNINTMQSNQSDFSISGSISGEMINRGNVPVSQLLTIIAFEDLDKDSTYTSADILLGEKLIEANLDVDTTSAFSLEVSGMQSFHQAPITVMLDSANLIAELSETNNTKGTAGLCSNQMQGPSLDLALCMDGSGSVSFSDFQLQLEGTAQAIENEAIVPRDGSVRVSAIQFTSSTRVELKPTIIEEDNVENIADSIRSIGKLGGGTAIHSCIATATSLLMSEEQKSSIQVIDVSTDGRSNYSSAVNASALALENGIDVLNSIGVGGGVDDNLLNAIVFPQPSGGDRGFVINVNGYQEYIEGISTKISLETKIPDLTLGGLSVVDSGSSLSVSMTVGNAGSGAISDSYVIRLYNLESEIITEREYFDPLASGDSILITLNDIDAKALASGVLIAEVASSNGLSECNSDNNRQEISVLSLVGKIQLTINANVFTANTDVVLTANVSNTGTLLGDYRGLVTITDKQGNIIKEVAYFDIEDLVTNTSIEKKYSWNTGLHISTEYLAKAVLMNTQGDVLSTDIASFTISELINNDGTGNGTPAAIARATTDRQTYHIDDTVTLNSLVKNVTSIHIIADSLLTLEVFAPDASKIYAEDIQLNTLVAGQIAERTKRLTLEQAKEGIYQYKLTLRENNNTEYASNTISFEVVNDIKAAVRGSVQAKTPQLYVGETQFCSFDLNNTGSNDIEGASIQLQVVNIDFQERHFLESYNFDLKKGVTINQVQGISTQGFAVGVYACVLEAKLNGEMHTLDSSMFEVEVPPLQVSMTQGSQDRVLVLTDEARECSALEDIKVELDAEVELNVNKKIEVLLYDMDGNLVDYEILSQLDVHINNNFSNPDADLIIKANSSGKFEVAIESTLGLEQQYKVVIKIKKNWVSSIEKSWDIDCTCDRPLTLNELYEDVRLLAWHPWHSDDDLRYVDPFGPIAGPTVTEQNEFLENVLQQNNWQYTLVHTAEDFAKEHRLGGYATYMILSERPHLHWHVQKEIREAVFAGKGLIVAGSYDKRNLWLEPALGISVLGRHPWAVGLEVKSSELSSEWQAPLAFDKAQGVWLKGAETLAEFSLLGDDPAGHWEWLDHSQGINSLIGLKRKAITGYDYGLGKSVFFSFDLLYQAANDESDVEFEHLINQSLEYVQPENLSNMYRASLPVDIQWTNQRGVVDVISELQLPQDVTLVEGDIFTQSNNTWLAEFSLQRSQVMNSRVYLQLGNASDVNSISLLTKSVDGDQETVQAPITISLTTVDLPTLDDTKNRLDSLAWSYWYRINYRTAWVKFKLAKAAIAHQHWHEAQTLLLLAADLLTIGSESDVVEARVELQKHIQFVSEQLAKAK